VNRGVIDQAAADQAAYEKRMQDLQAQWDKEWADLQRQQQEGQQALAQQRAKELTDCLKRASDQLAEDLKFAQNFGLGPSSTQQSQASYESSVELCHISFG